MKLVVGAVERGDLVGIEDVDLSDRHPVAVVLVEDGANSAEVVVDDPGLEPGPVELGEDRSRT